MKKIMGVFFIIISSCNAVSNSSHKDFEIILTSEYGGNENKTHQIIETNSTFITEVEKLKINDSDAIERLLQIDFTKNNILILHLGVKNSGGYKISVEKTEYKGNQMILYTKEIVPKKGEKVTMALTNPYCIVLIPKINDILVK